MLDTVLVCMLGRAPPIPLQLRRCRQHHHLWRLTRGPRVTDPLRWLLTQTLRERWFLLPVVRTPRAATPRLWFLLLLLLLLLLLAHAPRAVALPLWLLPLLLLPLLLAHTPRAVALRLWLPLFLLLFLLLLLLAHTPRAVALRLWLLLLLIWV